MINKWRTDVLKGLVTRIAKTETGKLISFHLGFETVLSVYLLIRNNVQLTLLI